MDEIQPIRKPFLFKAKKFTLIIVCGLNIILMVVYAALCSHLAQHYLHDYETFEPFRVSEAEMKVIIILVMISIFSISFSIIGIVGAVRESYTISLVFAVLSTINIAVTLANSIVRPYYIPCAVWAFIICAASVLVTRDLHLINRQKQYFRKSNH